jgi:membrane associated rhomboid family serine protease
VIPLRDTIPSRKTPVVVYLLIALNAFMFFQEAKIGLLSGGTGKELTKFLYYYGVVPARYSTEASTFSFFEQALPFVSSMFLHGGFLHIIGNMWMLWIFGDNVEDWFGHFGFLLFYLFCGVVAGAIHVLTNWTSTMPTIGASGAIAGVMGAYLILYPKARVVTLVPIFIFLQIMELPAYVFLGIWFAMQLLQGTAGGTSSVAWWAHIGGFLCGMALVVLVGGKRFVVGGGPKGGGRRSLSEKVDKFW